MLYFSSLVLAHHPKTNAIQIQAGTTGFGALPHCRLAVALHLELELCSQPDIGVRVMVMCVIHHLLLSYKESRFQPSLCHRMFSPSTEPTSISCVIPLTSYAILSANQKRTNQPMYPITKGHIIR